MGGQWDCQNRPRRRCAARRFGPARILDPVPSRRARLESRAFLRGPVLWRADQKECITIPRSCVPSLNIAVMRVPLPSPSDHLGQQAIVRNSTKIDIPLQFSPANNTTRVIEFIAGIRNKDARSSTGSYIKLSGAEFRGQPPRGQAMILLSCARLRGKIVIEFPTSTRLLAPPDSSRLVYHCSRDIYESFGPRIRVAVTDERIARTATIYLSN